MYGSRSSNLSTLLQFPLFSFPLGPHKTLSTHFCNTHNKYRSISFNIYVFQQTNDTQLSNVRLSTVWPSANIASRQNDCDRQTDASGCWHQYNISAWDSVVTLHWIWSVKRVKLTTLYCLASCADYCNILRYKIEHCKNWNQCSSWLSADASPWQYNRQYVGRYISLLHYNRSEPATCFGHPLWQSSGWGFYEE